MKFKKIVLLIFVFLMSVSFCYAADRESKVEGAMPPLNCKNFAYVITKTAKPDMDEARRVLFGEALDETIPDWIVYVDDKGNTYTGFAGDESTLENRDNSGKYPYIRDKNYIYVIFITDNQDIISNLISTSQNKTSTAKPAQANNDESKEIIVSIDSLQQYISNGQKVINAAMNFFTKISSSFADSGSNTSNKIALTPFKISTDGSCGKSVYYAAMIRISFNHNSENQMRMRYDTGKNLFEKNIYTKFGEKENSGLRFGISIAPLVWSNAPKSISASGTRTNLTIHGSIRDFVINGGDMDLLFHFYPCEQNPFRNIGLNSFNLFVGTPIVGGESSNICSVMHYGIGFSDILDKNIGFIIGSGVDFGSKNTISYIIGVDFKLF